MMPMHLSRWAEQWIIYMSTEFGFIKIADRYTTSSSMMPQKRNPDMLELIRGRCGNVYGDLFALMTILKGLPIGYNRDLQEDKRIVFRAYDTVSNCLTMAAAIVNSASYDKARIEPTLDRGFLDATSLAEYLVTKSSRSAPPTTSSARSSPTANARASMHCRSCRCSSSTT
jgi:argininosuccinate lyase